MVCTTDWRLRAVSEIINITTLSILLKLLCKYNILLIGGFMDYRDIERKNILELSFDEAKKFLLKDNSYCNFNLPPYFSFSEILQTADTILSGHTLKDISKMINSTKLKPDNPKNYDDVNYKLFNNKDGAFSWRPFQLINPLLYVNLVNIITEENNWKYLVNKFAEMQNVTNFDCVSIPVVSDTSKTDQAEQVLNYWSEFEQKSLELSLKFNHIIISDITDCYGSIYTHSISWALYGRDYSKQHRDEKNLGYQIDNVLQQMSYGQTNGIPQGSVLMDLIAEIVLNYADLLLKEKISHINDVFVLRYRDDYRIFVKKYEDGCCVLKALTEVLISLGLKLNSNKTISSTDIISCSIKKDKLAWMQQWQNNTKLQKRLLTIYGFSKVYPNSGTLLTLLTKFYNDIQNKIKLMNTLPLISIVVQIAYENPRTYPISSALISKLLNYQSSTHDKSAILWDIKRKFDQLPNVDYMNIWLQRISYFIYSSMQYSDKLCKVLDKTQKTIWNFEWLKEDIKNKFEHIDIVDRNRLLAMNYIIQLNEVNLFAYDEDVSDLFDSDASED